MALIQAMGMSSALGGLFQASAAFRAGLTGVATSPDLETFAKGDDEPQPVMVGQVPVATFGFSGVGALIAIAHEMFTDLGTRLDLVRVAQAPIYLALPDPWDREIDLFDDEDEAPGRIEAMGRRVLDQTAHNLGIGLTGPRRFFGGGSTAFAFALRAALEELGRTGQRLSLVAALDSQLSPPVVEDLHSRGRLKTKRTPVGFVPGEAGAILVLTTDRGLEVPRIDVRSVQLGQAPPWGDEAAPDGRPLSGCALAALGPVREPLFFVSDHNGEEHRASEWGLTLMQLRAQHSVFASAEAYFPAMGFGDVGAASAAVGACVGARALQRGYAPAPRCLVLSSSDDGERSAILLQREEQA